MREIDRMLAEIPGVGGIALPASVASRWSDLSSRARLNHSLTKEVSPVVCVEECPTK
jgi:hypothetical protein